MERRIRIIGDISYDSYREFSEAMEGLETETNGKTRPITIELSSDGGDPFVSLAFLSRMRKSPCALTIEIHGYAASAAVILLAGADKRRMAEEAWIMVHEERSTHKNSPLRDLETEVDHARLMERQAYKILSDYSNLTADEWAVLHKNTTYISSHEAKKMGVIDETF